MIHTKKNAISFAISFLTVLPGGNVSEGNGFDGAWVLRCFPLVGLLIGALLVAVDGALGALFPPLVVAVGDVAFLAFLTGGLHLDGLADSADALFSGVRDRDRMLAIMKDSRIGTMGALALILLVTQKAAAIGALVPLGRWPVLLVIPVAGRVAMLFMMAMLDYARPQGGLGSLFGRPDKTTLAGSVAFLVVLVLAGNGWRAGAGMLTAWICCLMLWIGFCRRSLGGMTGDTLGATSELAELAMLLGAFLWGR